MHTICGYVADAAGSDMICSHVVNIIIKIRVPRKETDIVTVQDVRKETHN
jgi:hypothetical protein